MRAGRRPDPAAEQTGDDAHGGQGSGIRHPNHAIDHVGLERGLDARPADPLDTRGPFADQRRIAQAPVIEEYRILDIGDAEPSGEIAEAQVTADGRRGIAGTGADDDPARHWILFQRYLLPERFDEVVVAAPAG